MKNRYTILLSVFLSIFLLIGHSKADPMAADLGAEITIAGTFTHSNGLEEKGITGEDNKNNGMEDTAPVSDPATMLLLGIGLIGLAGIGRKKAQFKKLRKHWDRLQYVPKFGVAAKER